MKKTIFLLLFLFLSYFIFSQDEGKAIIRFINVGAPTYTFTISKNKNNPEKTSLTNPLQELQKGSISDVYLIEPGSYYICGTYDKKGWGFNNRPNNFEANTEYFIMMIKPGEGYVIIEKKK